MVEVCGAAAVGAQGFNGFPTRRPMPANAGIVHVGRAAEASADKPWRVPAVDHFG